MAQSDSERRSPSPTRGLKVLAAVGVLAMLALLGSNIYDSLDKLGIRGEATWAVVGHDWERRIPIEENGVWEKEAWCRRMDVAFKEAYDVERSQKKSGTKKVRTGERCRGSGLDRKCKTTYKQVDEMDAWCGFRWKGWDVVEVAEAFGESASDSVVWPELSLVDGQRAGDKSARYSVLLQSGEKTVRCDLDDIETWRGMAVGSLWNTEHSLRYGSVDCEGLVPAE